MDNVFYRAAKGAGFRRFGFMSKTGLHIDISEKPGFYWCYNPSDSTHTDGSRFFCQTKNGNKAIAEGYLGYEIEECGGIEERNGLKCPEENKNDIGGGGGDNTEANKLAAEEQLEEICKRSDFGLVGYNGVCKDEGSGFDAMIALFQRALN